MCNPGCMRARMHAATQPDMLLPACTQMHTHKPTHTHIPVLTEAEAPHLARHKRRALIGRLLLLLGLQLPLLACLGQRAQ